MKIVRRERDQRLVFISMRQPDDPHTHLRDEEVLAETVKRSSDFFGRILAMPNVRPPLTSVQLCQQYLARVGLVQKNHMAHFNIDPDFRVYTALYLTDSTSPRDIEQVAQSDEVIACKLYPAQVTTGSSMGVSRITNIYPTLAMMEKLDVPLSVHGESSDPSVDIFDREAIFVDRTLTQIVKDFPGLRIIMEHVSTRTGVQFVQSASDNIAATVAPQHIMYSRNDMLLPYMRPDLFCFPILKREEDRKAVLAFATSGSPHVFLGTDSAPHPVSTKYSACVPGGFYVKNNVLDMYIKAFEKVGAIENFEKFASVHAAEFYGWKLNARKIAMQCDENNVFHLAR